MTPWTNSNYFEMYETRNYVGIRQVRQYFYVRSYDYLRPVFDALLSIRESFTP